MARLERTVGKLVERLGDESPTTTSNHGPSSPVNNIRNALDGPVGPVGPVGRQQFLGSDHNADSGLTAMDGPVFVIRDAAAEVGMGQHDSRLVGSVLPEGGADVISKGLITINDATTLLQL